MDPKALQHREANGEGPIPFPVELARSRPVDEAEAEALRRVGLPGSSADVLNALDTMSRRIDDLARELNVFGYFDDDPDRPRAA